MSDEEFRRIVAEYEEARQSVRLWLIVLAAVLLAVVGLAVVLS